MGGDASAFEALGLEPDADGAAIERAYKRLIKQHHPDREGGDARRAAEINRAYRELREPRARDALEFNEQPLEDSRRQRWMVGLVGVAVGLAAGVLLTGPMAPTMQRFWPAATPHLPLGQPGATIAGSIDEPINGALVDQAARDALHIARTKDEMALTAASQACHHKLRTEPTVEQLDRCAAFDDA